MEFALDQTGDIYLDARGNFATIDGIAAVAQRVWVRLNMHAGSWAFDVTAGVDYRGEVLGKGRNLSVIAALMKTQILLTPGVLRLRSFSLSLDPDTRVLAVEFVAETAAGLLQGLPPEEDTSALVLVPLMFKSGASVVWPAMMGGGIL